MDGSGYMPHREEPHGSDLTGDDKRPLFLLIVLVFLAAGAFFYLHREDAQLWGNCLFGSGRTCDSF
jgi:hypothetical protein